MSVISRRKPSITRRSPAACKRSSRWTLKFFSFVISRFFHGSRAVASPWSLDQVQDAGEQGVRLSRPADVDDPGVLQFVAEDADDQFEDVIVEGTEGAVDQHPRRRL